MWISRLLQTSVQSRDSALSWVALGASGLLQFTTTGLILNFGIFYNSFLEEFGESREKTAWVGSIPVSLMFFLATVTSWILGKISIRVCVAVTAIPLGLSLLMTSFVKSVNVAFVTFSIPFGIVSSLVLMSTSKATCIYFDKRLSTAYGLLTGGAALSQVGLSYVIIWLVSNFTMARTFQVLAAAFTCICLLSSLAFFPTNYQSENKEETSEKRGIKTYLNLLKNKGYCIYLFAIFVCSFSYAVSNIHQVQLAIEYGTPPSLARQFPVFSSIGMGCGRFCSGFIVDSKIFKTLNYYQSVLLLNGATALLGSFSTSSTHLIIYIWAFTFFDGQMQATFAPVVRDVVGLKYISEGFALVFTACSVSAMLGPPLLGLIVDKTQDYKAFFLMAGLPPIISCLILMPLRWMKNPESSDEEINSKMDEEEDAEGLLKEKKTTMPLPRETSV